MPVIGQDPSWVEPLGQAQMVIAMAWLSGVQAPAAPRPFGTSGTGWNVVVRVATSTSTNPLLRGSRLACWESPAGPPVSSSRWLSGDQEPVPV